MPDARKTKQTGFLVSIEVFIPAPHADMKRLHEIQTKADAAAASLGALAGAGAPVFLEVSATRR